MTEKSDDEEEKKDDEKSYHEESDENPDAVREREDAAKYIVETYAPVIVTVHQDSYIRFWTMEVCSVVAFLYPWQTVFVGEGGHCFDCAYVPLSIHYIFFVSSYMAK